MLGSWLFLLNGLKMQASHASPPLPPPPRPEPTEASFSCHRKDVPGSSWLPLQTDVQKDRARLLSHPPLAWSWTKPSPQTWAASSLCVPHRAGDSAPSWGHHGGRGRQAEGTRTGTCGSWSWFSFPLFRSLCKPSKLFCPQFLPLPNSNR